MDSIANIQTYHRLQIESNIRVARRHGKLLYSNICYILMSLWILYVMPIDTGFYRNYLDMRIIVRTVRQDKYEMANLCSTCNWTMNIVWLQLDLPSYFLTMSDDGEHLRFPTIIYNYRRRLYRIRKRYNRFLIHRNLPGSDRMSRLYRWYAQHQVYPYIVLYNRMFVNNVI